MLPRSRTFRNVLALGALVQGACLQLNEYALPVSGADAGDAATAPGPDAAPDLSAPADARDTATPIPPDAMAECTPREVGCADEKTIRTCSPEGRWTTGMSCPAQTICSAGACLCAGNCADELPFQFPSTGIAEDLVGGGSLLYLAINGQQASIRRFDLAAMKDTVVKSGGSAITFFSLDSDETGDLLWCSDLPASGSTGQLVHGTQTLEMGPCTHVRRRGNQAYYLGELLYRRGLDAGPRATVTAEPMKTFEIAGDFLYFTAQDDKMAQLKRLSLTDPTKVDTLASEPDATFPRLLPDASHVYYVSDGKILRVPLAGGAQPEVFWQDPTGVAWALAQTDTHVYWSTTTASGCSRAQVLRRAKAGGPATVLSVTPSYCGGGLVRIGDALYTALWVSPPSAMPGRILRIKL